MAVLLPAAESIRVVITLFIPYNTMTSEDFINLQAHNFTFPHFSSIGLCIDHEKHFNQFKQQRHALTRHYNSIQ